MSSREPQPFFSLCPVCQHPIDVSKEQPFAKRACPECGQLVRVRRNFDHFRIIRQIGEGGMSRVFEAEDEQLGRRVALKILNQTFSREQSRIEQFKREALITARLNHLNVIKLFTTGEDHGYFYIAMELVGGGSLEQLIRTMGRLPEEQALRIGREVAEGLRAGQKDGLIHRDVKPANILFTDTGTAKVVDFGLALFADTKDESGEIWATPYYVAPEKVLHNQEDFRSDIFSLGATLYHALTGRTPHKVDSVAMDEIARVKSKAVRLEDTGTKFGVGTVKVINRMMELDPDLRPQDYDAVVDELRLAERLARGGLRGRLGDRRRYFYMAGVAVAVLLAFLVGWMARSSGERAARSIESVSREDARALLNSGAIVPTGRESAAERFLAAREQLIRGRFAEARGGFEALIREGLKQPTLSWARYHIVVCAATQGDQKVVQRFLQQMEADEAATVGLAGNETRLFPLMGKRLLAKASDRVAVAKLDYRQDNEEVLGYLLHGLVEWHFGDPLAGAEAIQTCLDSMPTLKTSTGFATGVFDWIPPYVECFGGRYADDMDAARSLGNLGPVGEDLLQVQARLTQLEGMRDRLRTKGQMQETLRRHIQALQRQLARQRMSDQTSELVAQEERRKRELDQFNELLDLLPHFVQGYDFSKAVELLEGVRFESAAVQGALEGKIYLYSQARSFVQQLARDVVLRSWEGDVRLDDGTRLMGTVMTLNERELTLSLGKGSVTLATESVAPETLVAMAMGYTEETRDSTEYYERQEMTAVFARVMGLQAVSAMIAAPLMEENRGFRMRWLKVL